MNELENARTEITKADKEAAAVFEKRMKAVKTVADYKKANNLPVRDPAREAEMAEKYRDFISVTELTPFYRQLLKKTVDLSCDYQEEIIKDSAAEGCKILRIHHNSGSYGVYIGNGLIEKAGEIFDLDRKVMIVTDSGIPASYTEKVSSLCRQAFVYKFPAGEKSKTPGTLTDLLSYMLENDFRRNDCIVAVGGGVAGDIAGFAASCYMRGIDFYNIPTTLLAQTDSSIGGKTAVDLNGIKNAVGAFYQPKGVIVDPSLLNTLDKRQLSAGMAEVIKTAFIADKELIEILENCDNITGKAEEIISHCLSVKANVVENDPEETGLRRVLNFGHTVGHAIEAYYGGEKLHGECVAPGMIPMCSDEAREKLIALLKKFCLPTTFEGDKKALLPLMKKDKKAEGEIIHTVFVREPGSFEFLDMTAEEAAERIEKYL